MLTPEELTREYGPVLADHCARAGHSWMFAGGAWCGCEGWFGGLRWSGSCSVPVHKCAVCGDYDYGDNLVAREMRNRCRSDRASLAGVF
jgi:hypothetical protein